MKPVTKYYVCLVTIVTISHVLKYCHAPQFNRASKANYIESFKLNLVAIDLFIVKAVTINKFLEFKYFPIELKQNLRNIIFGVTKSKKKTTDPV